MRSVELFAGVGGMALGLAEAGFTHDVLVEWNPDAAATVAANKAARLAHVADWDYRTADVRGVDWTPWAGADLVAGGPPCQPFSMGGKARGALDSRDMWPEAIRAVREIRPRAFLFENVRGLLRPAFADYVGWVKAHLAAPTTERRLDEDIFAHAGRLADTEADYDVRVFLVDAADYGAAQRRHRVLFTGLRRDLGGALDLPSATHSEARLLWDQWVDGRYWERHGLTRPPTPERLARKVEALSAAPRPSSLPWMTCRDALSGLGEPSGANGHTAQPGARVYPGHTGSPLDEPAKALKAGAHGVPGGENMLVMPGGAVRYLTIREAARLQGLPDAYTFPRSWSESMRGLGNAVPTQLAAAFGYAMAARLIAA